MDIVAIIGFISSLVTIEEAGRSWGTGIPLFFKKKQRKKKILFAEWDTEDEITQGIIDAFKSNVTVAYKEHIFQQNEIEKISEAFLEDKSNWQLDKSQREMVRSFIRSTLEKYNEYNRSLMSHGERIIEDTIEGFANRIENKVDKVSERVDNVEQIINKDKEKSPFLKTSDNDDNRHAFFNAVHVSKCIRLEEIDNTINGEYSVDRGSLIKQISNESHRFISVQGNAGSGKSALCKTLIENVEYVLFARAEEMVRATCLNSLWGCELRSIFSEFSEDKIVIYIDALEFIADYSSEKYIVLQELYDIASEHANVFIISSCRTTDRNAFIKINTKYDVVTYEVEELTEEELEGISKHFPIIGELKKQHAYSEMLKNLFYINLVVSKNISIDNIVDENEFRDFIWKNIICLKEKSLQYGLESSEICYTVNTIVFERAKKFLLGIREDNVKTSILNALASEGIVTVSDGLVRLKYDIFEDICFEQYFDKAFEESRGNLNRFFEMITTLGLCVYRRYQIWIANKLFDKKQRDKFIYNILFTEKTDKEWKIQTEIGIVKSKYCGAFFREYVTEFKDKKLITDFLDVINLFAFEVRLIENNVGHDLKLLPVGKARECMILLLFNEKLYIDDNVKRSSIIKICSDYAKTVREADHVTNVVCRIIEYYLEKEISDYSSGWYYSSEERMGQLLTIEYMLAESATEWINKFFELIQKRYRSGDKHKRRWANDIAVWTFEHVYPALAKHCGGVLCELAICIYFEIGEVNKLLFESADEQEMNYGMSDNASRMHISSHNTFHYFLINLFRTNINCGLEWAINFTNIAFGNLKRNVPETITSVTLYFPDTGKKKQYYANQNMWICRAKEYMVPTIISDIVYYAKEVLIEHLEHYRQDQELFIRMSEWIKDEIYSKSNNVAIVSIIQEIGFHFQKELSGYALELASSYELLHWDISRYSLYHSSSVQKLLERQMLLTIGIPELKKRYEMDPKCDCNLQEYVLKCQLATEESIRNKALTIIDYLYELIDNGIYDHGLKYQAQKMDLRNISIKEVGAGIYEISPTVTEQMMDTNMQNMLQSKKELDGRINAAIEQMNEGLGNIEFSQVDDIINELTEIIKQDELLRIQYENQLVQMIVISLSNDNISSERRDELCKLWADGLRKLFHNDTFVADIKWVPILLKQLDGDLSYETINLIKQIILESIISQSGDGQIKKIAEYSRLYLETNHDLANTVFMTIIKLAENEMNRQKCNEEYLKRKSKNGEFTFAPNMQQIHLRGINHYIDRNGGEKAYYSKQQKIIQEYLLDEHPVDLSNFNIDNYDIQILCAVTNCGLSLRNNNLYMVIKQMVKIMINIDAQSDHKNTLFNILGVYAKHDVIMFFQRELGKDMETCEKALDILFDGIEFSMIKRDILELYVDIFSAFITFYFDSYQTKYERMKLEEKINLLEKRINIIGDSRVRTELTQAAALIDTKFYADWSKLKTSYSDRDKRFLNQQYAKYGHFHLEHFLCTLYQMHIKELLPEILLSVETVFVNSKSKDYNTFSQVMSKQQWIVDTLILDAFLHSSDEIKADEELSNAYVHILEMLIELQNEKAAVLHDEFLIH